MPNDAPDWSVAVATVGAGTVTLAGSGFAPTFRAAIDFAPVAAAADVFQISGSATKVVRVYKIRVSMDAAAAATVVVSVLLYTSALTGGGFTAVTKIGLNDGQPTSAADVALGYYTGTPTPGSLRGAICDVRYQAGPAGQSQAAHEWRFGEQSSEAPLSLPDVAHAWVVNLNGATVAGLSVEIEWTET